MTIKKIWLTAEQIAGESEYYSARKLKHFRLQDEAKETCECRDCLDKKVSGCKDCIGASGPPYRKLNGEILYRQDKFRTWERRQAHVARTYQRRTTLKYKAALEKHGEVDTREAARIIGCSVRTLEGYRHKGDPKFQYIVKLDGRIRYLRAQVERFTMSGRKIVRKKLPKDPDIARIRYSTYDAPDRTRPEKPKRKVGRPRLRR